MRWLLGLFALSLWLLPGLASADALAIPVETQNGCAIYTLCNAEQDVTAACDNGSDNIVAKLGGSRYTGTLYATTSDSTTFTCDAYTSDNGYQAINRTKLTSTSLSTSQFVISLEGVFADLWVECATSISGGTTTHVTIKYWACPLSR